MGFRVGEKAGGYEFLRVVDSSGPAMVYEVRNVVARRTEILKVLPTGLGEDRSRVERFLREAKIHSHLAHPNIAKFYRGFQLDGQLVMTVEKVEGISLETRLGEGPVTLVEAVEIACQILDALSYAHENNIVHREITPASFFLTPDGGVRLTGFGLAKQAADPRLTQPGTVVGAVHYMSPEQVKGIESIDGRSDIYALGVVLYEMVCGVKPFDSRSQFDIIQAHVMTPPPPPRELREDLPDELAQILLKALEKFPDDRYERAELFQKALLGIKPALETLAGKPAELRPGRTMAEIEEEEFGEAAAEQAPVELGLGARRPAGLTMQSSSAPAATLTAEPQAAPAGVPEPDAQPFRNGASEASAAAPAAPARPAASPPMAVAASAAAPTEGGAAAAAMDPAAVEGWRTRDLLIIGALTFVMVAAVVLAALILLDG